MINWIRLSALLFAMAFFCCGAETEQHAPVPAMPVDPPLEVGYSLPINSFTADKLQAAKAAGIAHVEVSGMSYFVDANRDFKHTDEAIVKTLTEARKRADEAGINIWSVHMPYGQFIDISLINEMDRQAVVDMHIKLVGFLKILEPEIILFHPSWYLGLNERDARKSQMIKSARALDTAVREAGATMVLENMLGPTLTVGTDRERPLMRTVQETQELFQRLPATVYLAVDMNHISHPEHLIRAMGARLRTVHVADGTGRAENHFYPCSGEGENDWPEILAALEEVGYDGPFLYESDYPDEEALVKCYQSLYAQYNDNR